MSLKKKFRSIQKLPRWVFWFPAALLKLFRHVFLRVRVLDPYQVIENSRERAVIGVAWHNRLLYFPAVFPAEARKRTAAVVSASRDGGYIADLISFFGLKSLRGSSSKRGAHAQLEAIRILKENISVCFTPDGPRGPRYYLHPGCVHLASVTGARIVPITIHASRYWQVRSWDGFQIPKPFARLTLELGEPIEVPPDLEAEGLEEYRKMVQERLRKLSRVEEDKTFKEVIK